MGLRGRHLRIPALLVLVSAAIVIVMLPGVANSCSAVPGQPPPDRGDGGITTGRLVTGAAAFVLALGLWIAATVRDTR